MVNILEAQYTGNLKVEVYNSTIASPIANAQVIVRNESQEELYRVTTGSDGATPLLTLSAPPILYSTQTDEPQPYTPYDIEIIAEDFRPILIKGVQIFPSTIALQPVYLERGEGNEEIITIQPPVLWGNYPEKIPENEIKEIPEETGFVILDSVVIPEYVVVHEGTPDSDGENYYVPFKDYIKNVASSEIYSTWESEAIRGNVLAIISFTLNRIYTEWYRSRGYDFTITNSTRYDQSFDYGRTIYTEISDIVDEVFTTYIKRVNSNQPLFAQYCDGKNVTCPNWLSQWGSQYLAQQGYSAIDILRYYYGDDIYLEQAYKVSGIPVSFPGEALIVGSSGEYVRTIQQQLNSVSNRYTAIPKLAVDGIYGENTANAVRQFQEIFNLPVTGVVDFSTWYEISRVYVSIEKLAQL